MPRHNRAATQTSRRGFILLAVILLVGSALLVTTALIFRAQGEQAGMRVAADAAQRRAMLPAAINVLTDRLNGQRERILSGEPAELEEQYELVTIGDRVIVLRLLAANAAGRRTVPEAGKLDVNSAVVDMLINTGMIDPNLAQAIIDYRDRRGAAVQSVYELLVLDEVTPEILLGFPDEESWFDELLGLNQFSAAGPSLPAGELALIDLLTTFAFEPAIQTSGRQRISLNVPWSDELASRLEDRFGPGSSTVVKEIMDQGVTFNDEAVIFEQLRQLNVPTEDWAEIVDALTTDDGAYHFGRLDINAASLEALLGLPTMEPEQAATILRARDGLDEETRATIAWPLTEGILDAAQYEAMAGRLTTRSWTYRLRVAIGEVDSDAMDGPIERSLVVELVIDLSSPRARVAYLRDLTQWPLATLLMRESRDAEGFELTWDRDLIQHDFPPAIGDASDAADDASSEDADAGASAAEGSSRPRQRIGRWRAHAD